jgi:peroxidase
MQRIRIFLIVLAGAIASVEALDYRSIDGTWNNLTSDHYGSAGEVLVRWVIPNYLDDLGEVDPARPNPRDISNAVFDQPGGVPDPNNVSDMVWAWGQFVDHDISITRSDPANEVLEIVIPTDDPFFGDLSPNNIIELDRSNHIAGFGGIRQQINEITAWVDGSNVYGSDAVRSAWLRTLDGTGRLRTSDGGNLGDLLPKWETGAPEMDAIGMPTMGTNAYVAGDTRANENTLLLSLHTVFVREHNRLAGLIKSAESALSGDAIHDRARKIVGAEIQAITYNEFLPALGLQLPDYAFYRPAINPAIANEFSTAAYRLHSTINETLLRLKEDGSSIPQGCVNLVDVYFNPVMLSEGGLDPIFRGLASQTGQSNDTQIADALRNQLFSIFVPGTGVVDNATDIASINIMRGRDHGLGTYNDTREALGFPAAASFADVTTDPALQAALEAAYGAGNVGGLDLYVGILAEDDLPGAISGELGMALLEDQFVRLRDADRFWHERTASGINDDLNRVDQWDGTTSEAARDFLATVTICEVVALNTGADSLQDNMFQSLGMVCVPRITSVQRGSGTFSVTFEAHDGETYHLLKADTPADLAGSPGTAASVMPLLDGPVTLTDPAALEIRAFYAVRRE